MLRYPFYYVISKLATFTPEPVAYGICWTLAFLRFQQFKAGRKAIDENMRIVLGDDYSPERARRIAREAMGDFSRNVYEIFRAPVLGDAFYEERCELVGGEHVDECLKRGKGAIFLSGHMGNPELAVSLYARRVKDITLIALPHPDSRADALFVNRRKLNGMQTLHSESAARPALKILKRNGVIAMLGERRTTPKGIPVEFFGREILFPKGPAWLATTSGAGVIPSVCLRLPDKKFKVISGPPIYPPEGASRDEKMLTITKRFASFLEHYVRRHPEQWATFYPFWGGGPEVLNSALG